MNAMDLLETIGDVRDIYIEEAREQRPGKRPSVRILLVAAVAAALLAGCAIVYALRLERMKMGTVEIPAAGSSTLSVLSLQGPAGSDSYNASKEWFEFLQTYEPTAEDTPLTEEEQRKYYGYACYTREAAGRIDEICEKYRLKLHGEVFHEVPPADMYRLLGIPGILRQEAQVENARWGGRMFETGSFYLEGSFTPDREIWPHSVSFFYQYNPKDVFDDVFSYWDSLENYEQWTYVTGDGIQLLLALGPGGAAMAADRTDAFLYCSFINGDYPDVEFSMERSQLEAIAELFAFSIEAKPLDEAALASARAIQQAVVEVRSAADPYAKDSYAAFAAYYLREYGASREPASYLIRDMNRDGVEDLVIFRDGMVEAMVTMKNGKTDWFGGNGSPWVLCENNVMFDRYDYPENFPDGTREGLAIFHYEGSQKVYTKSFLRGEDGWREWKNSVTSDTVYSEQEITELIESLGPIDVNALNLKPLKDLAGG